ncbi:MAG: GDSL-type esterase/lipase family protein [Deltaproteobacteria bacterium]|jgi:lysophospholipase L1-like esterase|nr:GDSL-type esterase/lipase family protein [Deltaproteobacteria bacterium]
MADKTIVTLGDSLTEWNQWYALDPNSRVINLGLSGDTAMGVYYRLNLVARQKPDLVFLQVGINDLAQGREPSELVQIHRRLWGAITARIPGVKLVVLSLAPVRKAKFAWIIETLTNQRVRRANALLAPAAQSAGLDYIDLYSVMAEADGELPDGYTDDGVHLTPAAYKVWLKELVTYLSQIAFSPPAPTESANPPQ